MDEPDPEPEWEEWMDAPVRERLSPYRYVFMAGCFFLLLPVGFLVALMLAMGCGAPGASDAGLCSYLP